MNLESNELLEAVKKIAEKVIPPFQNEEYIHTIPQPLWEAFAEGGLCGGVIKEEYEGLGLTPDIITKLLQEISKVDVGPAVFLSVHYMVSGLIQRHGTEEQKKRILPKSASGEFFLAFALTEPHAGSDASEIKSFAEIKDDDFILNGEKCYITSAGYATHYLVFAKTKKDSDAKNSISAFLLDAKSEGLKISAPDKKMGCELSPISSLYFDQIKIPKQNLIGELHQGYKVALSGLAGGRINIGACANGISECALKKVREFMLERKQFGKSISGFQGLQFMIADLLIALESSKLLVDSAAIELKVTGQSRMKASIAKCAATDAAMKITTDVVQLFGGAGYIKDYGVEKLMRDAKMLQIVEGTNQIQRMLIAREFFG